jgi:hypothetical protein
MSSRRVGVVVLAIFFALSRVVYIALGVRFDATPLGYFQQYPDPFLLRADLLRTSYYFHMTPPLYNVFLGVVLKVFGGNYVAALHTVYLLAGLFLAVSVYLLMRSLGAGQIPSLLLTAILVASPATVLYENWLYPDYLMAALLPFEAWLLGRAFARRSLPTLAAFFFIAGLIVLARSYYHLGWLILCAALVLLLARSWRRAVLVAAAVPILLGVALYAKNDVVFGFFSGTSASGINAYTLTTLQLTDSERQQLHAEGKISLLTIDPDAWFAEHPQLLVRHTGVPTLDEQVKSTGSPNWGNAGYIEVWNQYSKDAAATVRAHPSVLLRAARMGLLILFVPSDQYDFSPDNHAHVGTLGHWADTILYGQPHSIFRGNQDPTAYRGAQLTDRLPEVGWFIVAAYLLAFAYGVGRFLVSLREGQPPGLAPVLAFTLFTIGYILVIDVPFGIADNNRYRFMADPLVVALLAVAVTGGLNALRRLAGQRRHAVAAVPRRRDRLPHEAEYRQRDGERD